MSDSAPNLPQQPARTHYWEMGDQVQDAAHTIYRVAIEFDSDHTWKEVFDDLMQHPEAEQMAGLIVGYWAQDTLMDSNPNELFVQPLLAAAPRLKNLTSLYINDIESEESEISWIENTDLGPLLSAFPQLQQLTIKGGNGLLLSGLHLPQLRTLSIIAGGLSGELVRQVCQAQWPALEQLELWLGTEEYGASSTPSDLQPLLEAANLPKLQHLALMNSDHQDQIAQLFATAPVLARLSSLSLANGVLTDEGGEALLQGQFGHLQKLDLSFHWMSDEMMAKLEQKAQEWGLSIDLSDQQDVEDEWRYVALGE